MEIIWTRLAIAQRAAIYDYIEARNPRAALALDQLFGEKAQLLTRHPHMGRTGRVAGTRELVVHPNYLMQYAVTPMHIRILGVKHVAKQFP